MVTASNFGRICRMRDSTNTANFIETLLYKEVRGAAIDWGREHEKVALQQLIECEKCKVTPCGLFIHKDHSFVGASPDGLFGDDGVVKIKCPYSTRHMDPADAIHSGELEYMNKNGELKHSHKYYYQIQGQLEVTDRQYCRFVVWTPVNFITRTIVRDQEFWKNSIEPKLNIFYFHCLLPELVDPRGTRDLPLRSITLSSFQSQT